MTTINLEDEDLFVAVFGAGADSYPWYSRFRYDEEALEASVAINCEGIAAEVDPIGPSHLRWAIRDMVAKGASLGTIDFSDPECDSDFDAELADCIIQWVLLREVVFG